MQEEWIKVGYQNFALGGPDALAVERLASQVNKNKSSFYHFFGTMPIFVDELMDHHLEQAKLMSQKEAACASKEELIDILVEHQMDLLFNRQLRIHQSNPVYRKCLEKVEDTTVPALLRIWAKIIGLEDQPHLASQIFKIAIENFYLRLTTSNLTAAWLGDYFQEYEALVKAFRRAKF